MKKLLSLCIILLLSLSCDKEQDLVPEYVTINVSISKLQNNVSGFPDSTSGKGCEFPAGIIPKDLSYYYLTFESLDTGDIQVIELPDLNGSFEMKHYGNRYKLTVTTYNDILLPETSDQFHWYAETMIDLSVSPNIKVVLENNYSAIVVVNNDFSILNTPRLNGIDMYVNQDGWYIYSRVLGQELLTITKSDNTEVVYDLDFEPYMIYTYMYCDPMSLSISTKSAPFKKNTQNVFN